MTTKPYPLICAWCGKIIKRNYTNDPRGSHGICKACREKHFPQARGK